MSKLIRDENGNAVQNISINWNKIQNVSVSGSSAATSSGMPHGCTLAMLVSTTDCWFNTGTAPVAAKDATSVFLGAKVYFFIAVGEGTKVAFIQDSASGTAQVVPSL